MELTGIIWLLFVSLTSDDEPAMSLDSQSLTSSFCQLLIQRPLFAESASTLLPLRKSGLVTELDKLHEHLLPQHGGSGNFASVSDQ